MRDDAKLINDKLEVLNEAKEGACLEFIKTYKAGCGIYDHIKTAIEIEKEETKVYSKIEKLASDLEIKNDKPPHLTI